MELVAALDRAGIAYKHWKSNDKLWLSLRCEDDLDLIVRRSDASELQRLFAARGLRRVSDASRESFPAIEQYFALDAASGKWLHVDVYYAITTGSNLLKEYHLPVERLLLEGDARHLGVPVPQPGAELLTMVTIQMIKRSSLLQLITRKDARSTAATAAEIDALLERGPDAVAQAEALLPTYLPQLPADLWRACLASLRGGAGVLQLLRLGGRVRARLIDLRRTGRARGAWLRLSSLWQKLLHRRRPHRGSKSLATGGAVIAFVGPEATGKSTLVRTVAKTFGQHFDAQAVHLGKPPPTWLTWPFALAFPLLRRLLPSKRASVGPTLESSEDPGDNATTKRLSRPGWMYCARALITAHERRALARRVHSSAANGALVVCDRYPSGQVGAMDSARLPLELSGWRGRAAAIEQAIYRSIPPPALVIELSVDVEVALQRNRVRVKDRKESDQYVRHRHVNQAVPEFAAAATARVDTSGDLTQLAKRVLQLVWDGL